jgi:hypothetical protein
MEGRFGTGSKGKKNPTRILEASASKPDGRAAANPLLGIVPAEVNAQQSFGFSVGPRSDDDVTGPVVQWPDRESGLMI